MHLHHHDENNAPNQARTERPTDPGAGLAQGIPGAQPPADEKGAHDGRRHKTAAGLWAIYDTAHFGIREMGAKRNLQTLLKVNQKDGFDCPSCAWPNPDGKRKVAEFRENGAKAIASEATTKYPETNVLVPIRYVAAKSNQPASKSIVISIESCARQ